ncbi:MAG: nucleoside-diphosphate kinase [Acidimicrobiales bacterium]
MGRTLLICKPDAVERGLVGEILSRLERKGLRLVTADLRLIDEPLARRHYAEHTGKPFLEGLVSLVTRSPSFVAVIEAPGAAWAMLRLLMGATDPAGAAPGTIRGDLATGMPDNLVHGSDSEDSARREIELFFPGLACGAAASR